jgi:hypothetical protein
MKRIALLLVAVATAAAVAASSRTSTDADAEPAPQSAKGASRRLAVRRNQETSRHLT